MAWDPDREKHGCTGFGMCNVSIYGFCCTLNGEIVSCDDNNNNQSVQNTGQVTMDVATGLGVLTYKLNPNIDVEKLAISNQTVFYVDSDLSTEGVTVLAGKYEYNATVGNYGGYIINVIEN